MISNEPVILIVARYIARADAQSDLADVSRFFIEQDVPLYDAAIVSTDAWDQPRVSKRESSMLGANDLLRTAFALLSGDGAPARLAPAPEPEHGYDGLPWPNLERVAESLGPDESLLIAACQSDHPAEFLECFSRAEQVSRRDVAVNDQGELPSLSPALREMLPSA